MIVFIVDELFMCSVCMHVYKLIIIQNVFSPVKGALVRFVLRVFDMFDCCCCCESGMLSLFSTYVVYD